MTAKLISKANFAPAREIVEDRMKQLMSKITICESTGSISLNNEACIMQATGYVLGYELEKGQVEYSDHPPCTSAEITEFMIGINDGVSDRKRVKLKNVIPNIINTAPTVWKCVGGGGLGTSLPRTPLRFRLIQNIGDSDYRAAEEVREDMINKFKRENSFKDRWGDIDFLFDEVTMPKYLAFIKELADVAKFDAPS